MPGRDNLMDTMNHGTTRFEKYHEWLIEVKTRLSIQQQTLDDFEQRLRALERFKTAALSQTAIVSVVLSAAVGFFFTWLAGKL
jgi:hypothetical protein